MEPRLNPTDSLKETTSKQTFKHKLLMENYFDVPKILGGQEPAVHIIGVHRPLELLVPAPTNTYDRFPE